MVICLEQGTDLHTAQLMPLPLTASCFSKILMVLPFWYWLTQVVPDKEPLNVCVCVFVYCSNLFAFILHRQCLFTLCRVIVAVIGDWRTAVSRKERKNRSKRDHKRTTSLGDLPPHTMETQNYSASVGSNKSKMKVHALFVVA